MSVMYIRDKNGKLVPVQTIKGKDYVLTEADKQEMVNAVIAALSYETWAFELEDGSTVNKEVYIRG